MLGMEVCLAVMLTGLQPFDSEKLRDIAELAQTKPSMSTMPWVLTSDSARDLLSKLLEVRRRVSVPVSVCECEEFVVRWALWNISQESSW